MKIRLLGWCSLLLASALPVLARPVQFERAFAPQEGLVSPYERGPRQEICLNGNWQFLATTNLSVPGDEPNLDGDWDKVNIKIPSPWNVNGFSMSDGAPGGDFRCYPSYPKEWEEVKAAWMRKTITVPKDWQGRRLVLHFEAVAGDMTVFVNGKRAGAGFDIFFPQEFDVTYLVRPGAENEVLVNVVTPKVFNKPGKYGHREYLAGSFWGSFIAGIWQDVFLEARPEVSVSDVFVQPWLDRDELLVEAAVVNQGRQVAELNISGKVHEWLNQADKSIVDAPEVRWKLADREALGIPEQALTLQPGETRKVTLSVKPGGKLKTWSPENPNLYGLLLSVSASGKPVDTKYTRFGWRQFSVKDGRFQLNGAPFVMRGDSWHFMGVPQMTRRYAAAWYELLKDAGANAVRLHASIYPEFYHDMADEMGIVILDESAIWLSDGGPKADSELFWANCRDHVEKLVRRDRNHPSVFGWSVCNESLAVLRGVWHAPPSMVDRGLAEISAWTAICRTNDPTRPWISGDGEGDAEGRLPVYNIHYGDEAELRRAAKTGKPFGVGETSMAYYGTPKQVARFNGERAYESALGRMEGLAYECYSLLRDQQKAGADYQSVFNIAWYAVRPLPGEVVFGRFQEGVPGMQPERLGPYVSTLNPGYNLRLPLYDPWPMFDAIRDINTGRTNSPWAKPPKFEKRETIAAAATNGTSLSCLPATSPQLIAELEKAGIMLAAFTNGVRNLLLDGSDATLMKAAQPEFHRTLHAGGTVWIWGVTSESAPTVSELLRVSVTAEPREASSFVIKRATPLVAGLSNAALYFSEADDWQQMSHGLGGALVERGDVLLEAAPADWRKWNYKGEPVKTAALVRSEVERPGARAVLVTREVAKGRVILCNLSPKIGSQQKMEVVRQLMSNAGIAVIPVGPQNAFLNFNGQLTCALVSGGLLMDTEGGYGDQLDIGEARNGVSWRGVKWTIRDTGTSGIFDFKNPRVDGGLDQATVYLSVWIKSPKPLNDLLSEPNLPKLSFTYGSDDGCQVWLNGERLGSHDRIGPLDPEMFKLDPLLLKLGWNQIVIKVVQAGGGWQFTGKFGCSDLTFLEKLDFSTERPEE